jgi:hypothetical protein
MRSLKTALGSKMAIEKCLTTVLGRKNVIKMP